MYARVIVRQSSDIFIGTQCIRENKGDRTAAEPYIVQTSSVLPKTFNISLNRDKTEWYLSQETSGLNLSVKCCYT